MKTRKLSLVVILLFIFMSSLFSEEITAKSSISAVTIFPDRATIIREAGLSLGLGTHSIVYEGLPVTLIPNSLRVTGRGTAAVKILGIDLSREYLEASLLPEVQKLQGEIDALQLEINQTQDRIEVLLAQEKFLKSIESTHAAQASQEVRLGKPDIQSWERVIDFLGRKLQEVKVSQLEQKTILKEQQTKLDALQKKLNSIKPRRPKESMKATVILATSRQGKFTLNLSYTVVNSRWTPLYTMRALPDSSEIEFSMSANIQQRSGENWENVKALLSTSSPALTPKPPELPPWILDIYTPRPPLARKKRAVAGKEVGGVLEEAVTVAEPAEPAMVDAEMAAAGILETGLNLNFAIEKSIQIPSDGAPHKVPIDSQKIEMEYDYISVPKLKAAAFLRGNFRNTLLYPLLSGNADLFVVQDFIGSTRLPFIARDEEAKMYFGEDRQIAVQHERVQREKSPPGFLGKTERVKLVYRITVQNLRKNQVKIDVLDQLPVSQNTKIEIKDLNIRPQPSKKDEKGILTWTLTLEPQEKREVLIGFTIEYPKGAHIIGI
ncbi:MAG: mucoidy inhibitor MuiA family protein [Candidatus Aminicenantes bacterium]|nr:mucoidy inhibitor MuiA family protein [Candidatus Aminicenantes bacterium]